MIVLQSFTPQQRRGTYLSRPACILGLLLFAALCGPLAHASEVYAYLGSDFSEATSNYYTTSDFISGLFTTSSPLGPDLVDQAIVPVSYSFSDGVFGWTNSNSVIYMSVTTDHYGTLVSAPLVIVGDRIFPAVGGSCSMCRMSIDASGDSVMADVYFGSVFLSGSAGNSTPGIWGPDFDPTATPEPAPAVLTSTALLAFAVFARKRMTQGIR